ncbi:MAG: hypothetical protein ACRDQF_13610 [Thermocrispum sp.]
MAEFDPKQVSTYEWLGIGAGAVAFVNSFLPWFSIGGSFGISANGWDVGFLGFASVLLLVGAAVVVVLPHFGVSVGQVPLIWLGMSAVAFLFTLLRWLTYPSGVGIGVSFGTFIALVAALASAAGAFLCFKQTTQPKTP